MNADVKATCLAALKMWRHNAIELNKAYVMDDHGKTMARIANALAALEVDAPQGSWQPLTITDDDIVATDIQGRDIAPAKVLTTVVDGRHITMRFADSDKPFMSWEFLPHIRLCRRIDNPAPQVSEGLDFPDGVGWWAFEGLYRWRNTIQCVYNVTAYKTDNEVIKDDYCPAIEIDGKPGWYPSRYATGKRQWDGKWYKLTMPWDATQPQEGNRDAI